MALRPHVVVPATLRAGSPFRIGDWQPLAACYALDDPGTQPNRRLTWTPSPAEAAGAFAGRCSKDRPRGDSAVFSRRMAHGLALYGIARSDAAATATAFRVRTWMPLGASPALLVAVQPLREALGYTAFCLPLPTFAAAGRGVSRRKPSFRPCSRLGRARAGASRAARTRATQAWAHTSQRPSQIRSTGHSMARRVEQAHAADGVIGVRSSPLQLATSIWAERAGPR
jgi:hypothetical protein